MFKKLSIGLLSLLVSPVLAAEPLASLLPDDAVLFLNVRDVNALEAAQNHPLMKPLKTGDLGKALAPLLAKISGKVEDDTAAVIKEETGLTAEELFEKFPGGAAASIQMDIPKWIESEMEEMPELGMVLIADYTGDDALMEKVVKLMDRLGSISAEKKKAAAKEAGEEAAEELEDGEKPDADWPADYEENVREAGGVKVHEWTVRDPDKKNGDTLSWSVCDGKAMISLGDDELLDIVSRIAQPSSEGSLGAAVAWKSLPDGDRNADVLFGVNLASVLPQIQEGLRIKLEKGELETGMPVNPLQIWAGLGIDKFQSMCISATVEEEDAVMHVGFTYEEMPAVLSIYTAKGPGEPPSFATADYAQIGWGTLDWGAMFDQVKQVAAMVSPVVGGGLEMGLNEMKKKLGVDYRADILGQMGDGLWTVQQNSPPSSIGKPETPEEEDEDAAVEPETELVMGIALRDSKAFHIALKSMFNAAAPGAGLFDDREYLGNTIHQLKNAPPGMSIGWLIKDDTLILSIGKNTELLEKVLGGMAKPPAVPLMEDPIVKAAFARMPDGHISSSYANAGGMIDTVLEALRPMLEESAEGEFADMLDELPDTLDLPWIVIQRMYISNESMDARVRISGKP